MAPSAPTSPTITLPQVLHYLQSTHRNHLSLQNSWEIERAELRARVALLEGEKRSWEQAKTDLARRVRMLEWALKMERYVSCPHLTMWIDGEFDRSAFFPAPNTCHRTKRRTVLRHIPWDYPPASLPLYVWAIWGQDQLETRPLDPRVQSMTTRLYRLLQVCTLQSRVFIDIPFQSI